MKHTTTSPKFTTEIIIASYPLTNEYGAIIPGPRVLTPVVRVRIEDFVYDFDIESLLLGQFCADDVKMLAEEVGMAPAALFSHIERIAIEHDASR